MDDDDDLYFFSNLDKNKSSGGSRATRPSIGTSNSSGTTSISRGIREIAIEEAEEEEQVETPFQQLIRHWMNERHTIAILPFQGDILGGILDRVREQGSIISTLRNHPQASDQENLRIMLVATEVERVKFVVRSYLRTRLFKIEKYARFIMTDLETQAMLSASEQQHAFRHAKLTDDHLNKSVLQGLPETQATLDDTPAFVPPMVTEPDKSRAVFIRARKLCPGVRLPDGSSTDFAKGAISLVPYWVVEQIILRGEAELV